MTRETWNDMEARRRGEPTEDERREASELAALCRDVLGTDKGRKLLAWMRARTKDSVLGPGVSESALWYREGQRQLVDQLERATAHGLTISVGQLRDELPKD